MGAPAEVLAQARKNAGARAELRVLPCNLDAVNVFWAMSTQWRIAASGMSGGSLTGLDYAALPVTLRLLNISRARWPGVFDGMRVIEIAALKALRERENR